MRGKRHIPSLWKRAMESVILSNTGHIYLVRSNKKPKAGDEWTYYTCDVKAKTCECVWPGSGCVHLIAAATHWFNMHNYEVELCSSNEPGADPEYYKDKDEAGAAGQFIFTDDQLKLLLYQLPEGCRIDQTGGIAYPIPLKPDTVEDLPILRERLWHVPAGSKEQEHLLIRVRALEDIQTNRSMDYQSPPDEVIPKPIEFPVDYPRLTVNGSFSTQLGARSYLQVGYSVVPLEPGLPYPNLPTHPDRYLEFFSRQPTLDEIAYWTSDETTDFRWAFCGGYAGLFGLEFHSADMHKSWLDRLMALDAEYWFSVFDSIPYIKTHDWLIALFSIEGVSATSLENTIFSWIDHNNPGISSYGFGSFILAPDSKHYSGVRYSWQSVDYVPLKLSSERYSQILEASR